MSVNKATGLAAPTRISGRNALLLGIAASLGFTGLIWLLGGRLLNVPHYPDFGADWYYWRLMEPTYFSRATAWGLYLAHQAAFWAFIYYGQTRARRFGGNLTRLNVVALGVNALFIGLHLAQTHLLYDGLAQDVSIWTSQGSVVAMLVLILLMENGRRGLFFGKRAPLPQEAIRLVRRYHGYVFAWAAVYTFWYHPTEATTGHLIGFFYMFLLLLQGSLLYTRAHLNRVWTLALEATVLVHGALVAFGQGNNLWPMFAFGFGGILVVTQVHGLALPKAARFGALGVYVALVALVYAGQPLIKLNEIVRIPIIEYLLVFAFAFLIDGTARLVRVLRSKEMPRLASEE